MTMTLTDDLVARVARAHVDAGDTPELHYLAAADFLQIRTNLLSELPPGQDLWIFAYGSLLWNPCFAIAEEGHGTLHGWHRRFYFWLTRWQGTREQPGLMLSLDRGGCCRGVLFRIPPGGNDVAVDNLLQREMSATPPTNVPRWVTVRSGGEDIKAITFVADRAGPSYAAGVSERTSVAVLALAAGHVGSCADYLHQAVRSLESRKIRDRNLWRLQAKVAAFIAEIRPGEPLPILEKEIHHACEG